MTARLLLLLVGLLLLGFDVARLTITGVAVLGVLLMVIAFWLYGGLTRRFWFADDEASARLSAVDVEIDAHTPARGGRALWGAPTSGGVDASGGSLTDGDR